MFHPVFVMLRLIYTCAFFDCQVDFDVDNIQRRELVNMSVWGIALYKSYYYYNNYNYYYRILFAGTEKEKDTKEDAVSLFS